MEEGICRESNEVENREIANSNFYKTAQLLAIKEQLLGVSSWNLQM